MAGYNWNVSKPLQAAAVSIVLRVAESAFPAYAEYLFERSSTMTPPTLMIFLALAAAAFAQDTASEPALTIYNQDFAVVRQSIPVQLKAGANEVTTTEITAHVEPDSVVLRDPQGRNLQVLEQNYRNDPVSQELLLSLYEGKTIDFLAGTDKDGNKVIVQGKIVRSGYVPHFQAYARYEQQYQIQQQAVAYGGSGQPIIEVNGKLQFFLPGQPLFPSLADDTILKPTLGWLIQADKPANTNAELSYITDGMTWHADYNVVAPSLGDVLDVVGWVTLENQSGKTFTNARIKLMAGDVNKIVNPQKIMQYATLDAGVGGGFPGGPQVTEKAFEEFHLYTLDRSTTLRDRESKQVEFIRAAGVKSKRIYVYDGMKIDPQYRNWPMENIRQNATYGTQSNTKVWVMQEIKNSKENNLGMPLPTGRVRFYRRDDDGRLEFTGENNIDHTPADEMLRLYTGNAFDVVGERRQTHFRVNTSENWADEAFEIKLRNHKKEAVTVRVVEHMFRWTNWVISQNTVKFSPMDARTIEFVVDVPPDSEKTISYAVHYSW